MRASRVKMLWAYYRERFPNYRAGDWKWLKRTWNRIPRKQRNEDELDKRVIVAATRKGALVARKKLVHKRPV